ncbi:MerR family DNA-binding transcriptional regulator [Geomicrobium sediminis]|uniref:DNA-binding transcriptional MerR regulator n=1 Tax=Geomicrobium sediminis TaxID=1347788 RepID=A0ABS2PD46_9BACL|nr:MerR family transcriptional regulator [Geomicrobium sediminis]MBM7633192.1 DNA-binding transcriptional MerR regulator [Geomicrobium sediminis]
MKVYKPIEIARIVGVSTSALRHYESWGIVPKPERFENGYRKYTDVHLAYFRCLRAMFPAFGHALTSEVVLDIKNGNQDQAFWRMNKAQADLQYEKMTTDQTLEMLRNPELPLSLKGTIKEEMTIGEVAEITDVLPSSIRHWEKEGLITPKRNLENGYRIYQSTHVRQILLLRTMRKTVFFIDQMREIVQAVEHHSVQKAKQSAEQAREYISERNRLQMNAIYEVIRLCKVINQEDEDDY